MVHFGIIPNKEFRALLFLNSQPFNHAQYPFNENIQIYLKYFWATFVYRVKQPHQ